MMHNVIRLIQLQPYMPAASEDCVVPELRLSGAWLEQQGFHAWDLAEVTICDGALVIKPVAL